MSRIVTYKAWSRSLRRVVIESYPQGFQSWDGVGDYCRRRAVSTW
jgi:hypothetical protein